MGWVLRGGYGESRSPVDPSRMPRVTAWPGNNGDTDVQTRDCARFKSTEAFGVPSRVIGSIYRRLWVSGGVFGSGGQIEDVHLAVVIEVTAGLGELGVLLVGPEGNG